MTFTFTQAVSAITLGADKDANPALGTRTTGSTSPDPITHGQVTKADFNDLQTIFTTPPVVTCGGAPASSCRQPLGAGKSTLQVTDKAPDAKDRLLWKWQKGAATTVADFGNPRVNTAYGLCIYDGSSTLIASATIPAGGTCNAKSPRPCWRASRNGFRYVDRDLTPSGIQQLVLRAGALELCRGAAARQGALRHPRPPISSLPSGARELGRAMLEATYSTTFRNQDDRLKAKSD